MAKTAARIVGPTQLAAAAATLYTVPAGTLAIVTSVWVNTPDAARTFTLSIGADAAGTRVWTTYALTQNVPYVTYPMWRIAAAEVIQAFASAATSVVIVISADLYTVG